MLKIYLELFSEYIMIFITLLLLFGLISALIVIVLNNEFFYNDDKKATKSIVIGIITPLVLSALFVFVQINMYVSTRTYQEDIQKLKIKYGLENYKLVIKDREGNVLFEKEGYFTYSKTNNQVTITDIVNKTTEIITIDDDMELKVKVTRDENN